MQELYRCDCGNAILPSAWNLGVRVCVGCAVKIRCKTDKRVLECPKCRFRWRFGDNGEK